ncbi:tetratricopeptide repeat protein [Deinococcus koreensis]|uniref:SARP family transcriptional regulator n=1 Tax=Deinococcus koreensis TaxID=2054903 RepID=A0A2K3UTN6_9DEIO|nr:tetratricopeptide repeat protein [Deinococcus koreensis]PNY79905.1 SARP family transcriptional regulator [Deinococcus koreensis]
MRLRTLGGLALDGAGLGRPKPLLLLTYLTLEGPRPRRYLGELFWRDAVSPTNSIAVAVRQIRQAAPGALQGDDVRLWADLPCDALEIERALRGRQPGRALELYAGAFLDGAGLPGGSTELEEWVYTRRELLAAQVQGAALELAQQAAAQGDFGGAAGWAERALHLAGAPEPPPEFWARAYPLLVAGHSPQAEEVRRRAQEWALRLDLSPDEARRRLRPAVIGREREVRQLGRLPAGAWAWVRGDPGMGKTTLLRRLDGVFLGARAGLPYATLEPLLGPEVPGDEHARLRRLAALPGTWLIDGWAELDPESRTLLGTLRGLGTQARVIVAAAEAPPFAVDAQLDLGALDEAELAAHAGAFEATGGLPGLLGAWLRGEPIEPVLQAGLAALPDTARQVHGALTLLDLPELPRVRQALALDAPTFSRAVETLLGAGLIDVSGQVRARATARRALQAQPTRHAALALRLARTLRGRAAYGLYQSARALWDEADLSAVQAVTLDWAAEALRRGFPLQAAGALADAPPHPAPGPELGVLRARALERAGQFREALSALDELPELPLVSALRGALAWRLGHPEQARRHAEAALDSGGEARAEALNTLAHLDFQRGHHRAAERQYRRAATLWLTLGDTARWAGALNNRAAALSAAGEDAEAAFQAALDAAGEHLVMRARTTLNLGQVRERRHDAAGAAAAYRDAALLAEQAGSLNTSARAWNNLGALHHRAGRPAEARAAYDTALALAQRAGEPLLLGTVLANLAELTGDGDAFEEALRVIGESGNHDQLARSQADYQAFIERSRGAGQA